MKLQDLREDLIISTITESQFEETLSQIVELYEKEQCKDNLDNRIDGCGIAVTKNTKVNDLVKFYLGKTRASLEKHAENDNCSSEPNKRKRPQLCRKSIIQHLADVYNKTVTQIRKKIAQIASKLN